MTNVEKIFRAKEKHLKKILKNQMSELGYTSAQIHNKADYLYVEGDAPYMLVAHLDTVHQDSPEIICYSKDGRYMMSPQGIGGDDRCGVIIILALLKQLPFKPYVLFTTQEETGGVGAEIFCEDVKSIPDLKYIVEFDRKGNDDCVFYDCDNQDFVDFVEQFGFTEAYGTFSDINVIAPHLGVAAVNLSSGYYNPHCEHEYVDLYEIATIIDKAYQMLTAESTSFEYIESKLVRKYYIPHRSYYSQLYGIEKDDFYKDANYYDDEWHDYDSTGTHIRLLNK